MDTALPNEAISREPFPGSKKVYAQGSDPSIRVPFRAIALTNGEIHTGLRHERAFTDPDVAIDVRAGIAPLRSGWIEERNDTSNWRSRRRVSHRPRIDGRTRRYPFQIAASRAPREARRERDADALRAQGASSRKRWSTSRFVRIASRRSCAMKSRAARRDHGEHQPSRTRTADSSGAISW